MLRVGAAAARGAHARVEHRVVLLVHVGGQLGLGLALHADAEGCWPFSRTGAPSSVPGRRVAVHAQDVLRHQAVPGVLDVVGHDEEQIETRQQRVGQGDVLVGVLVGVVLAEDGVRGGDDAAAGVEGGVDAGLGRW